MVEANKVSGSLDAFWRAIEGITEENRILLVMGHDPYVGTLLIPAGRLCVEIRARLDILGEYVQLPDCKRGDTELFSVPLLDWDEPGRGDPRKPISGDVDRVESRMSAAFGRARSRKPQDLQYRKDVTVSLRDFQDAGKVLSTLAVAFGLSSMADAVRMEGCVIEVSTGRSFFQDGVPQFAATIYFAD